MTLLSTSTKTKKTNKTVKILFKKNMNSQKYCSSSRYTIIKTVHKFSCYEEKYQQYSCN